MNPTDVPPLDDSDDDVSSVYSVCSNCFRPKEKYALFPVTCPKFLGSIGRETFFFYQNFFVWKKYKILKNSLKIDFNIPKDF